MKTASYRYAVSVMVLASVCLVGGCANMTPIRENPDFASGTRKIQTVAILPPEVEQVRIVFNGDDERMTEKEHAIAEELTQSVGKLLKIKQYTVRQSFAAKEKETNKDMNFELQQVRTAYSEAAKQLYEKSATEEESKKYRVSIGPVVNPIATFMDADALLYVRYYGFEKSGGQQAKDVVAGALLAILTGTAIVRPAQGAMIEVALIDGATGDVLWANRSSDAGAPGQAQGAAVMGTNIMTPLPGTEAAVVENGNSATKVVGSSSTVPTH